MLNVIDDSNAEWTLVVRSNSETIYVPRAYIEVYTPPTAPSAPSQSTSVDIQQQTVPASSGAVRAPKFIRAQGVAPAPGGMSRIMNRPTSMVVAPAPAQEVVEPVAAPPAAAPQEAEPKAAEEPASADKKDRRSRIRGLFSTKSRSRSSNVLAAQSEDAAAAGDAPPEAPPADSASANASRSSSESNLSRENSTSDATRKAAVSNPRVPVIQATSFRGPTAPKLADGHTANTLPWMQAVEESKRVEVYQSLSAAQRRFQAAAFHLVKTEQDYVTNLMRAISLRDKMRHQRVLDESTISQMFGNIDDLAKLSRSLLTAFDRLRLKGRFAPLHLIVSEAFTEHQSQFAIFAIYACEIKKARECYEAQMKKKAFRTFLQVRF